MKLLAAHDESVIVYEIVSGVSEFRVNSFKINFSSTL